MGHRVGVGVDDRERAVGAIGQIHAMVDGADHGEVGCPAGVYALPRRHRGDHRIGVGVDDRYGLVGLVVDVDLGMLRVDGGRDGRVTYADRFQNGVRALVDGGDRVVGIAGDV